IGRPLRWLVRVSCAYPAVTVVGALGLAVVSVLYTLTTLTFQTSNLGLMPPGQPYIERYRQYDREFGELDDLAIVVEAPSLPEATLYARRLVRELRAARVPLARIAYRIDPKQFEGRALLYLSKEKLLSIRDKIFDYQEFMETFADRPTLDQLVDGIATQVASAFVTSFIDLGLSDSKPALDVRFVEDLVAQISARLDRPTPYHSPWGALFPGGDEHPGAGYFLSEDERLLFILVEPESERGSFTGDRRAIEGVRAVIRSLGIDYGIYFLFRYEEELFLGRSLREAIEITAARSGPGMLLGAVTAAGTFYVLCLTEFRGVQELGFIAGTAILLSWVATMTVFPATLVLLDHRHARRPSGTIPRALALERVHVPLVERIMTYPKTVLVFAVLLTGVSAWGLKYIQFDYNLLHLQASGTESVVWERKILAVAGRSGFTALASADSLEELRRKHAAFGRLPTVSGVDSALLLIPDDQPEKQKIIRDFAPIVAQVRIGRATPIDLDRLITAFETLKRRFDIAGNEAPEGETAQKLRDVSAAIERLVIKVRQTDPDVSESALTYLQTQIYNDFVRNFQRLQANLSPRPIGLKDIPPELRRKFTSEQGRFLLHIQPAVDIWDREGALRFITELRSVDPEVTGTPIITFEAIRFMERIASKVMIG